MKIFISLLTFICICFGDVLEDGVTTVNGNYCTAGIKK